MDDDISVVAVIGGCVATFIIIWALIFGINVVSSRATPQAGEIGVVRSGPATSWVGDWFNGHSIKKIIEPGSGNQSIGLGSVVHWYPADSVQRNYTITSDASRGDRPGVDVVEVPTGDGVRVGLEGTFYFTTAFNASAEGQQLLKDFDNRFGVRTFPVIGSNGNELHPWQGIDGWSAFLDTVIRPIIDNDLRRAVGSVQCAQLVSSCSLVHQQSVAALKNSGGSTNNAQIQQIQDQINQTLSADIKQTLGHDYFSDVQFLLSKVALPTSIQDQIDAAQAQFAAVGTAQAQVQQAHLQAKANSERESGYKGCPACAQIDELKAIPSNVTTYAPGAGFAVTH